MLVQEAEPDEFTVGADALIAKWDGKNNSEQDLPAGKYHARGYLVGRLKVEDKGHAADFSPDSSAPDHVQVKLVSNPLAKDTRPVVDLRVNRRLILQIFAFEFDPVIDRRRMQLERDLFPRVQRGAAKPGGFAKSMLKLGRGRHPALTNKDMTR